MNGSGGGPPESCASLVLSSYTNETCQGALFQCKANTDGNACIDKVCTDYAGVSTD